MLSETWTYLRAISLPRLYIVKGSLFFFKFLLHCSGKWAKVNVSNLQTNQPSLKPICEGIRSPGIGVTDKCEQSFGCWELNLGHLEEKTVVFSSEPSLYTLKFTFKWILIHTYFHKNHCPFSDDWVDIIVVFIYSRMLCANWLCGDSPIPIWRSSWLWSFAFNLKAPFICFVIEFLQMS